MSSAALRIPLSCLALLMVSTGARGQIEALQISLEPARALVTGVESGGSAALLVFERDRLASATALSARIEAGVDSDGDGAVEFQLDRAPAEDALWLAGEAATGRFGASSTSDGGIKTFKQALGYVTGGGAEPRLLAVTGHESCHLLLLRPGVGAWHQLWVDGGWGEETGVADARLTLYAPSWSQLTGDVPDPGALQESDFLIAVDPSTLEVDARLVGGLNELP